MNLLIEAVQASGETLYASNNIPRFPIATLDLQEVFYKFNDPANWTQPIVVLHEPEIKEVSFEDEGPQPTRKPYKFASGYVVPSDVAAGKLGKRKWSSVYSSQGIWDNPDSLLANGGVPVSVLRQERKIILKAKAPEVDELLDGTAVILERYKGSYLDKGGKFTDQESATALTFYEEVPYGISTVNSVRKSELFKRYRIVPASAESVRFQGIIHFQNGESTPTFEFVDKNIVTGHKGFTDSAMQTYNTKRFFTECHPTHTESTPFMRLIRSGIVLQNS